jgi:hypothetical protein
MSTATLARSRAAAPAERLSTIGRVFIVVMLTVIFEGAVRKWVASSATLPLVLLRDVLAVYTVVHAFMHGQLRRQPQWSVILLIWACCVVGWGLLQLTLAQSNFPVLLIGLRFWLLYVAFGVAAASSMTEHDLRVAIRVLLATLVLTAPLGVLQHYSPVGAFVNKSLDTEEEDIFVVVLGVVRTTGTFSFTAGYVAYLAVCTPFVLGALDARKVNNRQRLGALILFACLAAAAMTSGARTSVILTAAMLALYLASNLMVSPARKKGLALISAILVLLTVAVLITVFQSAVEVTQERFQVAGESEDLATRVLVTFFGETWIYDVADWLGSGLGLGSNLAQYVQTGNRAVFALAESEPGRTLLEGGLLGWAYIALKYVIVLYAMTKSFVRALSRHTVFPLLVWSMISVALITWPIIGQLTANGLFGVLLAMGLLVFRYPNFRLFG